MHAKKRSRGFSFVELMIVVVVIVLIAAMAVPNVTQGIQTIRLRESVLSIAGLCQKARLEAVRTNRFSMVRHATDQNIDFYFIDGKNSVPPYQRAMDPGEQRVQVANNVQMIARASAPPFDSVALLGFQTNSDLNTFNVIFNQRGLPCRSPGDLDYPSDCQLTGISTTSTSSAYYLYFFQLASPFGTRYAALSITPAGRIRVWTWNGSTWS